MRIFFVERAIAPSSEPKMRNEGLAEAVSPLKLVLVTAASD